MNKPHLVRAAAFYGPPGEAHSWAPLVPTLGDHLAISFGYSSIGKASMGGRRKPKQMLYRETGEDPWSKRACHPFSSSQISLGWETLLDLPTPAFIHLAAV